MNASSPAVPSNPLRYTHLIIYSTTASTSLPHLPLYRATSPLTPINLHSSHVSHHAFIAGPNPHTLLLIPDYIDSNADARTNPLSNAPITSSLHPPPIPIRSLDIRTRDPEERTIQQRGRAATMRALTQTSSFPHEPQPPPQSLHPTSRPLTLPSPSLLPLFVDLAVTALCILFSSSRGGEMMRGGRRRERGRYVGGRREGGDGNGAIGEGCRGVGGRGERG